MKMRKIKISVTKFAVSKLKDHAKGKFSLDSRWCALCDSNTSKKFEVIAKKMSHKFGSASKNSRLRLVLQCESEASKAQLAEALQSAVQLLRWFVHELL